MGRCARTMSSGSHGRSKRRDAAALRELVGELHEADVGDLIEALDPELRPRLIELLGRDFDFTALTEVDDTVREEILEELPAETVAEGVRELDSDDAVAILEDLPKDEQAEILEQLPAPERVALARSLDYPENSAGRRMQTEFIAVAAVLDRRARPSTTCARRPICRTASASSTWSIRTAGSRRGRARPAAAHQAAGADRRADGRGTAPGAARPTTRRRSRGCSSATTWSRRRWSTRTSGWSASSPSTTSST